MSTLSHLSWGAAQFITKLGTRQKWIRRGIPPEKMKTLAQKIAGLLNLQFKILNFIIHQNLIF